MNQWCKQWGWKYTLEGQKRKSQAFVFIVFVMSNHIVPQRKKNETA